MCASGLLLFLFFFLDRNCFIFLFMFEFDNLENYQLICRFYRGTKRLVSVNICSMEGNSADIFVSKVLPGIFVIKVK